MPIHSQNITEKTACEESTIKDRVQLEFCSSACLLHTVPEDSRWVYSGQTQSTRYGILTGGSLYLAIAGQPRPASHVLGDQHNSAGARERWSKLIAVASPNLMAVEGCCDCTARVAVIKGLPLVDANTTPAWLKRIVGSRQVLSHDRPVPFAQWAGWMGGLAAGLGALHREGLAHGDPFPFNVIIAEERAAWVDYSHLSDDPRQQVKDLWCFLFFTVLFSWPFCAEWSPGLQERLIELYDREDWSTLAADLAAAFAGPWDDLQPAPSHDQLISGFMDRLSERGVFERAGLPGRIGAALLSRSSLLYYTSFMEWIRIGNETRAQLDMERVRHQLIESEHLRLRVPLGQYQELQAQMYDKVAENRELTAKHDWVAQERLRLLEDDEKKQEEKKKLLASNEWLAGESARLVELVDQNNAEQKRLMGLVEQSSAENTRLAAELQKLGEDHHALYERVIELNETLHAREAEINRLAGIIQSNEGVIHQLEDHIHTLNLRLSELGEQLQKKEQELWAVAQTIKLERHEIDRLAGELTASRARYHETWHLLLSAHHELTLRHDEIDLYHQGMDYYEAALQKNIELLMQLIEPLLGNIAAFRASKTYKLGILAGALLRGKLAPLAQLLKQLGRRKDAPAEFPENEIVVTIGQLASQLNLAVQGADDLYQHARPALPPLPAPPAAPPALAQAPAENEPPATQPAEAEPVLACQPLVSVLMPVYNHADMLGGAIESVRGQTWANWELVLLDDGSTDNIEEVLTLYADDPRIRIYRQQNQKLPVALTHLHQLARGEFITWTSADNLLAPPMLERLMQAIAEDPGTVMVYADTALIDEWGRPLDSAGYRDHNRDTATPDLMRLARNVEALGEEPDNFINACFLYRAQAARAVGPYGHDLNALEDYDFFLRLRRAGRCRHVGNEAPLYFYRVHRRTMSEEALTKDLEAHVRRGQMLIDYDKARGRWFARRWNVVISGALPPEEQSRLRELLEQLPVNIIDEASEPGCPATPEALKRVRLVAPGETPGADGACIVCGAADYTLLKLAGGAAHEIARVPRGHEVSPLALKSRRQLNPSRYHEYAQAGERPILGTHLAFQDVDAGRTIALIQSQPQLFFALIDDERRADPERGAAIAQACPNSLYLGPRPFGQCYWGYADFAAVFCPPLAREDGEDAVRQAHQLALACGRWLLFPRAAAPRESLPFAAAYDAEDPLPQAWLCPRPLDRQQLLDDYLVHGSQAGSLKHALRLLGTAFQESAAARPDFGPMLPAKDAPHPWRPREVAPRLRGGWIGLWLDTLDRGGLEEVVALLAHELRARGVPVRILCSDKGGLVAGQLAAAGFPCEIFAGDAARFEAYLRREAPLLLSSHYTKQLAEIPAKLGIPVVETIHNMYVHYSEAAWDEERRRSGGFTHAIAVSQLVRDYYLKRHGAMGASRVSVVNNAADPRRTLGIERTHARRMLGIAEHCCVFLNLASFDGRKNQIGLLTAFERLHAEQPDTRLIFMGNSFSPFYFDLLLRQLEGSPCRAAVRIMDYQKDVARILAAADVCVIPSYFEGWSISATEARHAGLPLIHTRCGSGPELCEDGGGYLVDNPAGDLLQIDSTQFSQIILNPHPPNTEGLLNAMRRAHGELLKERGARHRMRTDAIARYSVSRMIDEYLEIFRIAVEGGAAPDKAIPV